MTILGYGEKFIKPSKEIILSSLLLSCLSSVLVTIFTYHDCVDPVDDRDKVDIET